MEQIVKAFMGIFFLMLLFSLGIGILSAQMDVQQARDCKASVVAEIENSNFSPSVMNECIAQAKNAGYGIQIKVYQPDGVHSYDSADVSDTSDAYLAEVMLSYPYEIGVLHSRTMHTISGFAG